MKAFRVLVNGRPLCTAGISHDGVLSGHVTWVGRGGAGHLHMHVGGLDSTTQEHIRWSVPEVQVGDEIAFQIVEVEEVDAPASREQRDLACEPGGG